jgi:cell division protein FtsB
MTIGQFRRSASASAWDLIQVELQTAAKASEDISLDTKEVKKEARVYLLEKHIDTASSSAITDAREKPNMLK